MCIRTIPTPSNAKPYIPEIRLCILQGSDRPQTVIFDDGVRFSSSPTGYQNFTRSVKFWHRANSFRKKNDIRCGGDCHVHTANNLLLIIGFSAFEVPVTKHKQQTHSSSNISRGLCLLVCLLKARMHANAQAPRGDPFPFSVLSQIAKTTAQKSKFKRTAFAF